MNALLDQALRSLQASLFARELYDAGHPSIVDPQRNAAKALTNLLRTREHVTVIALEDRVVSENERLPSSASLAAGLFGRLRANGIECMTFDRGVDAQELARLLDQLPADPDGPVRSSAHVRLGAIGEDGRATAAELDGLAGMLLVPRQQAIALQHVWRQLHGGSGCDVGALGDIVAEICTTAAIDGASMLPLAALKRHDEYTFTHTTNVAILSAALAEVVGLGPDDVHDITIAALLHDVGKRLVPRRVLNKEAALTDSERRVMQRHPLDGARLLFESPDVPELARIVAFEHHVHIDGTGYPRVAPGWKLHPASRIVQIADVFDALRTHRPYRAALSLDESISIMQANAGTQYDEALLDLFVDRVAMRTDRERRAA